MLLPQRVAVITRQLLFTRLAIDSEQSIHEHDDALQLRVSCLGIGLQLDRVDKLSACVRDAARVDHALGADILFIGGVSIRVKYAAIVFEEGFRNFFAARHLEVEDHALARRTVLPEVAGVIAALLLIGLHSDISLVGLDVITGKQIALHHFDDQRCGVARGRTVDPDSSPYSGSPLHLQRSTKAAISQLQNG